MGAFKFEESQSLNGSVGRTQGAQPQEDEVTGRETAKRGRGPDENSGFLLHFITKGAKIQRSVCARRWGGRPCVP